jgi:hypothetical protein
MRKIVGFELLVRSCRQVRNLSHAQRSDVRQARSSDTVSEGLRGKRISRGRKQDTRPNYRGQQRFFLTTCFLDDVFNKVLTLLLFAQVAATFDFE